MPIKYIKYTEINKDLWDKCVYNAPNVLIYGMSWYLDQVCSSWDALVLGNYEAVMPLPWKKKFGIKYIYQPWFAQQLGIFGMEPENIKVSDFIEAIPKKFLRYEISFNYMYGMESTTAQPRNNYLLSLETSYEALMSSYNENTLRNIKKSNKPGFALTRNIATDEFMNLMLLEIGFLLDDKQRSILNNLIKLLCQDNYGDIVGIKDEYGELYGAVLFVRFKKRIIYLFSAANQKGKEFRVMFKIVDEIIKENCGTSVILDFEGSMNDGIARFYKGFGSQMETYHLINKKVLGII